MEMKMDTQDRNIVTDYPEPFLLQMGDRVSLSDQEDLANSGDKNILMAYSYSGTPRTPDDHT